VVASIFCSHLNRLARFNRQDLQVEILPNGIFRATTGPESTCCLVFTYRVGEDRRAKVAGGSGRYMLWK